MLDGRLRLFPLNAVLFPGTTLNLHVFEPRYKQLIDECLKEGEPFGVALVLEGGEAGDPNVIPHSVGTVAHIKEVTPLPFGRYYVATLGQQRFHIEKIVSREPFLTARVVYLSDAPLREKECQSLADQVRVALRQYLRLLIEVWPGDVDIDPAGDASEVSYVAAHALQIAEPLKQRLLELSNTKQRLTTEMRLLRRLIPQLKRLLERRQAVAGAAPAFGAAFRARQDKLFGKHFSLN